MKRKPVWGQDTPIAQLWVILVAIEGDLCNMQEGIASKQAPSRATTLTREAQEISAAISRGDNPHAWDNE